MIEQILLRTVPKELAPLVASGAYRVFGSVVRDAASGQIKGHLQETALLGTLFSGGLPGSADLTAPGMAMRVAELGMGVAEIVQNEQIKSAMTLLQSLQIFNLAMSAASIGVSAAGTALLFRKIKTVEDKVDALGGRLEAMTRGIEALRADALADLFTRLRATAEQLEEAWHLADPNPQWQRVATEAHALGALFERRAAAIAEAGTPNPLLMEPILEATALAGATRTTARLACNDLVAAREAANQNIRTMAKLSEGLQLLPPVMAQMGKAKADYGSDSWGETLKESAERVSGALRAIRLREAAAAGSAFTTAEIAQRGIDGRAWLETARLTTDVPTLFLASAGD